MCDDFACTSDFNMNKPFPWREKHHLHPHRSVKLPLNREKFLDWVAKCLQNRPPRRQQRFLDDRDCPRRLIDSFRQMFYVKHTLLGAIIEGDAMRDAAAWPTVDQFLSLSNEELGGVDPVVMNLVVAKGIPALADLDIGRYVALADKWAADIERNIPAADANFYRRPHYWQNDLDFARLWPVWRYVEVVLGVSYRLDQRGLTEVYYTDPGDLFLNGVMDTRQGTCGNMALLYVVLCRRLNWPVSLACVNSHSIARYDDGKKAFNIEASQTGDRCGLSSQTDDWYVEHNKLPKCAVECGSDLRA